MLSQVVIALFVLLGGYAFFLQSKLTMEVASAASLPLFRREDSPISGCSSMSHEFSKEIMACRSLEVAALSAAEASRGKARIVSQLRYMTSLRHTCPSDYPRFSRAEALHFCKMHHASTQRPTAS